MQAQIHHALRGAASVPALEWSLRITSTMHRQGLAATTIYPFLLEEDDWPIPSPSVLEGPHALAQIGAWLRGNLSAERMELLWLRISTPRLARETMR